MAHRPFGFRDADRGTRRAYTFVLPGTTACRRSAAAVGASPNACLDAEGMTDDETTIPASDERVRTLLERYKCAVPFHEVRSRFVGDIATPVVSASPLNVVEDLWGGELPAFDSIEGRGETKAASPPQPATVSPRDARGGATRVMNISRDAPGELLSASLLPSEIVRASQKNSKDTSTPGSNEVPPPHTGQAVRTGTISTATTRLDGKPGPDPARDAW
jgi:hypothetical protein